MLLMNELMTHLEYALLCMEYQEDLEDSEEE